MTGDFRQINTATIPDRYPIPRIHDFPAFLHGKNIFTSLDFLKAFNQIPVNPDDIQKTAVITPVGLFEFTAMIPGLRNAGQTFQRYVDRAMAGLDFVFAFYDDMLIASSTPEEHEEHLRIVLERLDRFHLLVNWEKCVFGERELTFLSHKVNASGFHPFDEKLSAIRNFPKPFSQADLSA